MRQCLIVLGMHRSGTSALTRTLSLAGADLPATLMASSETTTKSNPKGHWESEALTRFNNRLLESAGISWESPEMISDAWIKSGHVDRYKGEAATLLRDEFGESQLFVFKDPRLCKLMPFWLDVFEDAGISPFVVTMSRSPNEVAQSLSVRNGLAPCLGELTWLRYVLEAERTSRDIPRCHVSYDGLLNDWPSVIEAVEDKFGIELPAVSGASERRIAAFLSKSERHHKAAPRTSVARTVSKWCDEVFAIMQNWEADGEKSQDQARFDEIAPALDKILSPLMPQVLEAYEASKAAAKLQRACADQGEALQRLTNDAKSLAAAIEDAIARERLTPLESDERAGNGPVEDPASLLHRLVEGLRNREEKALKAARKREEQQRHSFDVLRTRIVELEARGELLAEELTKSASEASDLKEQLAAALAEHRSTYSELSEWKAGFEQLSADKSALSDDIIALKSQIASLEDERDNLATDASRLSELSDQLDANYRIVQELRVEADKKRRDNQKLRESLANAEALSRQRKKTTLDARQKVGKLEDEQKSLRGLLDLTKSKLADARTSLEDEKRHQAAKLTTADNYAADLNFEIERLQSRLEDQRGESDEKIERLERLVRSLSEQLHYQADSTPQWAARLQQVINGRPHHDDEAVELLRSSDLFDPAFYLTTYPDVSGSGVDPIRHYLEYGAPEGRAPSAAFDGRAYVAAYPDVAESNANPLVHFLKFGLAEKRRYSPVSGTQDKAIAQLADEEDAGETLESSETPSDPGSAAVAESDTADVVQGEDDAAIAVPDEISTASTELRLAEGSFAALAAFAKDWVRSASVPAENGLAIDEVRLGTRQGPASSDLPPALAFFSEGASQSAAPTGEDGLRRIIRTSMAEGDVTVAKAWLQTETELRLMLANRSDRDLVVRVAQHGEDGKLRLCHEALVLADRESLCPIRLMHRFRPVLLVICATDGMLIDAAALPFPSLLSGGLHFGELVVANPSSASLDRYEDYCVALLTSLDPAMGAPGIDTVLIDLDDASGTEAILAADFRQWLRFEFGVRVLPRHADSDMGPGATALAERLLQIDPAEPAQRDTQQAVVLPHDAVPSLALLAARRADLEKMDTARTILIEPAGNRPVRSLSQPLSDSSNSTALAQPFIPPVAGPKNRAGAPVIFSLRNRARETSFVRTAFPTAPDAKRIVGGEQKPISVVIQSSGDEAGLRALIHSLEQQQGICALDCTIIGPVNHELGHSTKEVAGAPVRYHALDSSGVDRIDALDAAIENALHEQVLLLDDGKILHDRRTVEILQTKLDGAQVGTVGCSVISGEYPLKKGQAPHVSLGWIVASNAANGTHLGQPLFDPADVRDDMAVLANPLSSLLTRKDAWSAAKAHRTQSSDCADVNVGMAFHTAGFANIVTPCVAIASAPASEHPQTASVADHAPGQFPAIELIEY